MEIIDELKDISDIIEDINDSHNKCQSNLKNNYGISNYNWINDDSISLGSNVSEQNSVNSMSRTTSKMSRGCCDNGGLQTVEFKFNAW